MNAGSDLVNESGQALDNIVTSVVKVGDIVAEIASASQEQAAGIDQVSRTVHSLEDLTQQNAALAEQTSAASVSMNERACQMSAQVEFFQINHEDIDPAPKPARAPAPTRPAAVEPIGGARPHNRPSDQADDWEEF